MNIFQKIKKYVEYYLFGNKTYLKYLKYLDVLDSLFTDILTAQQITKKSLLFVYNDSNSNFKICVCPKNNGGYFLTYSIDNSVFETTNLLDIFILHEINENILLTEIQRVKYDTHMIIMCGE